MNICFYAPFKPLGHRRPSGDLVIARGLFNFLKDCGHHIWLASSLRVRWIYWKPWLWPLIWRDCQRLIRQFHRQSPDLWLTYHTYYKAPDVLGPYLTRQMRIPYVIFQGIFSTKRRKHWKTWPGYVLNKAALCSARHVFTNRQEDLLNLRRLLPERRLTYVTPGIFPFDVPFDADARRAMRQAWNVGDTPVVLTAAMFRPGVKTQGVAWVIRACGELFRQGLRFYLVIAGDGKERQHLMTLARNVSPERVRFVGKVPREQMYRFYSAGDVFAFPGIRESLGMVYLEAQSCGLPVVAFANGGVPEVVKHRHTGYLVHPYALDEFVNAMKLLLTDTTLRLNMGRAAHEYVRRVHDLNTNYKIIETILNDAVYR